jgi:hypothetical protein
MTTNVFFTTLIAFLLQMSAFATPVTQNSGDEPITKFVIILNAGNTDATASTQKFGNMLPEVMKSMDIKHIYTCPSASASPTFEALLNGKNIKATPFDTDQLSSSLYDIYVANQGSTSVICADYKSAAKILNMLTGTKDYGKFTDSDQFKVFIVESDRLGKGTVKTYDFRKQI